jgi:hypothetical protein
MATIPQTRSRQFDEKVDFNDSLEVLKPLVNTLGAQGQRDMMGWTETPFQTLQKKAGSAGTNEAMRDFTVRKVDDRNKPRAVTYGIPGINTMMNPDDWIYARQSMGANLIASMAPGVVSTEMVNPFKQRGMNSLGATATQTQLYVEGANRQLPFSNLDIEQVEFDATNELRKRTKEETSGWALQQFDPTLISMHHKKLNENTFGLGRLGRRAASQNAFSKSTVINNITNNTNSGFNTTTNQMLNIYAPGGVGGYGKGGGGGRGGPGGGAGGAGGGDPNDDDGADDDDNPGSTGISTATEKALFDGDHGKGASGVGGDGSIDLGGDVAAEGMTGGSTNIGVATVLGPTSTQERRAPPFAVINNTDPGHNTANEVALVPYVIPGDAGAAPTGAINIQPPKKVKGRNLKGRFAKLTEPEYGAPEPYDGSIVIPHPMDVDNPDYVPEEYHPTIDAGRKRAKALADHLQGQYNPDGSAGHGQATRHGSVDHSALNSALVANTGMARYSFHPGTRTANLGMLQEPSVRPPFGNQYRDPSVPPPFTVGRPQERLYDDDDYQMTSYNPSASKRRTDGGDYNDRDKGSRVVPGESMALISFDNRNRPTVRAGGDYFGEGSSKKSTTLPSGVVARFTDPDAAGLKRTIGREHLNAPVMKKSSTYHGSSEIVTIDDGNGHLVHARDVEIIPQYRSSRFTEDAYAAVTQKRRHKTIPGNDEHGLPRGDVIRRDNGRYAVRNVSGTRSDIIGNERNREDLRRIFNYMKQKSGVV